MGNILHKLARKILRGSATEAEQHFMDTYYDAFDKANLREDVLTTEEETTLRNHIDQGIQTHIQRRNIIRFRKWLPYAAAVAILAVLGGTWIFLSGDRRALTDPVLIAEKILPGGDHATLTLANGRTIDLDETQTGITVSGGITYSDGSYVVEERKTTSEQGQGNLNTESGKLTTDYYVLTTPKGGTYQITLSDGTKVWLNAASTLKYPSRFDESTRVVEVSGEAYFAVATDKSKPFMVNSIGQTVEVLGTEFNLSAYPEENEIKTTLVEGEVKIVNLKSQISNRLKPGEQAVVAGPAMNISNVSIEPYTAWKDGFFYFDNVPPQVAIEQVVRWYDLEVVYKGNMPETSVFGMVERTKPLSAVLKSLGKSGLDFEIRQGDAKKQLLVKRK